MEYTSIYTERLATCKRQLQEQCIDLDVETLGYGLWSLTAIECLASNGYKFDCELHNYEEWTKDQWIPLAELVTGMNLYDFMDENKV